MGDSSRGSVADLIKQTKVGDLRSLAKLLTALERLGPRVLSEHPELLTPDKPVFRFGVTGPPGAGKSTLIGQFIAKLRAASLKVAVMAIDPSSPFTQGAVLGDRIRYSAHFNDPGVFIRSLGTRGSLGGLSASAYLMLRAFDLSQFDIVLLETVGVGQTELEIMNVADAIAVVLVPESGDSIQAMKAGLLEISDFFIVNKADRPGAAQFANELAAALMLEGRSEKSQQVILQTSATTGDGVVEVIEKLSEEMRSVDWRARRLSIDRLRAEAKALLRLEMERLVAARIGAVATPKELAGLFSESPWAGFLQ